MPKKKERKREREREPSYNSEAAVLEYLMQDRRWGC
jgi:hypothetical protein